MRILGGVLIAFALAVFAAGLDARSPPETLKIHTAGVLFLAWGVAAWRYAARGHRGGVATVVGAFLLGLGAWAALGWLYWGAGDPALQGPAGILAAALLLLAGRALLAQGRQVNRREHAGR